MNYLEINSEVQNFLPITIPIPRTERITGIIKENVWAPARIREVVSNGIISPPTTTCGKSQPWPGKSFSTMVELTPTSFASTNFGYRDTVTTDCIERTFETN